MATFNFFVSVTDRSGKPIYSGNQAVNLTEDDLKAATKAMDDHDGYVADLDDLGKIGDKIGEDIINRLDYVDELADYDNWDNLTIDIDNTIPDELLNAISKYVTKKNVDFKIDCVKDGKPKSTYLNMDINSRVFNKMVELAGQPHDDLSDIAFLKLKGYAEHEELIPVLEKKLLELSNSGTYDRISYNGDFPYQVYESL